MAFPTTGVLEDGTGADEDPIETHWNSSGQSWIAGDTGNLAKISNQITNETGGGTDTSSNYDGVSGSQTYSPPLEVWATVVTASTVTNDQFNLVALTGAIGDVNADGYDLHIVKAAGADTWQLRRRDNVTPTVLGADPLGTQEVGDGDSVGFSIVSGVLTAYYKASGGSWTQIGTTRSDSTYSGPFYIGIKTVQASPLAWKTVPFGGGTVAGGGPGDDPPIGFLGRGVGW